MVTVATSVVAPRRVGPVSALLSGPRRPCPTGGPRGPRAGSPRHALLSSPGYPPCRYNPGDGRGRAVPAATRAVLSGSSWHRPPGVANAPPALGPEHDGRVR